jgi:cytidine deaminase
MSALDPATRAALEAAARAARDGAYAPYSHFTVGAALLFSDGAMVTGANVENASYGLSLCAETVAASLAMNQGRRGGLIAVAVAGGIVHTEGVHTEGPPVTPCGRCRQVLFELASLGETDPLVLGLGAFETVEMPLSALLPHAFGPGHVG